jgi:ABC-type transport system involved in multi-copper enzyme maturation permease subunit
LNAATSASFGLFGGALTVARREIRDQLRDWRILIPIILLTLFFPALMNFTARQAVEFVGRYGAPLIAERLIPFLLMVVGFFPVSISLVIALESFAGERERLSLEPLLATPLTEGQLYLGKMLASLAPPLAASYLGIGVYLTGLAIQIGWRPPAMLLAQVILLTTAQALVMVSGAVVISLQTTSVRAANLLASFIILPVSQLIIGESLIMFWGRYAILWWIVLALVVIAAVLGRMGLHLFNREEVLGREFDVLKLRSGWDYFRQAFVRGAKNPFEWYRGLFRLSLAPLWPSLAILAAALAAAYFVGSRVASEYRLPLQMLQLDSLDRGTMATLAEYGFLSGRGWLWVLTNNLRAMALAALAGSFSFGVLAIILLMAPVGIIGYFAGNMALAGHDVGRFLLALVLPHAVFEIPAAIVGGAAILQLGLAAISPPRGRSLGQNLLLAFAEWARLLLGLVVPLLAAAAAIEVFVTPRIALLLLPGM